ncbi:putative fluoride ion transporter CrcB [uncultured Pleomorphomonas sp.]|uniref:Fluoride-specific ion channel FluC n=1 Tax=uncultured Pleomorphomonas sp. TaxID=442121 RepID=A0A212LPM6_9HYPH|nr:fluoride efflux transporter CrcB [uncultured Pleomorphomonas sp.]SCM79535.1 putative fluoride ion transporter CrcB [uncultured Pleomorphomonas sp.]
MGFYGFLLVFIGGGIGSALRHGSALAAARWFGTGLPYGTLFVNILGSFVMGVISEYWALKSGLPQPARLFLTTGIIGGFTTFSTFSLDTAVLWERGEGPASLAYVAGSVVLSIGALFAGLALVRLLVVPAQA